MKEPFGLLFFATGGSTLTAAQGQPEFVAPELHVNIWESDRNAFIDIGLMFDIRETMSSMEVVFPWAVKQEHVVDLYDRIATRDAISAVFNEGWAITSTSDAVVSDPKDATKNFALVKVYDPNGGTKAVTEQMYGNHHGLKVNVQALKASASSAASPISVLIWRFYIRIRILQADRNFYCVGEKEKNVSLVPSWQRTDVIDFRVNVRRGVPHGLVTTVGGALLEFSKVQLFLMRTRDQDIVFEDQLFKACRSLEDEEFWAKYSLKASATPDEVKQNLAVVERSLGYQWKDARKPPDTVKEFGILARFKVVEFGWKMFVLVALLLGALGNGLWDLFKGYVWDPLPAPPAVVQANSVNTSEIFNRARQERFEGVKKK